jgi:DNA polymerase-3 subunit epsilon
LKRPERYLETPVIFFDIESTGTDVTKDRIVSLAAVKIDESGAEQWFEILCNPGIVMSPEIVAIHGITNESVANCPTFDDVAALVLEFFHGCDLGGYNLKRFDIPMLWEELWRAGYELDLEGVRVIDVGNIFRKMERRTLSAAVQFYCGRNHEGAHTARADTQATLDVFLAQRDKYFDIAMMTMDELHAFSRLSEFEQVDLAGKILKDANGEYIYGMRSKQGVRVLDDIGFAEWMLGKDFPENTKIILRKILREYYDEYKPASRFDHGDEPYDY